jgi:glutamine amidotransferase
MGYIGIIDYGAGNLMSVKNSLAFLGFAYQISDERKVLAQADKLILPGVGAFPAAMEQLEATGLVDFIKEEALKKPLLGICLGMQMLFEESNEIRICKGLSLVEGTVRKIETDRKLPHIGWNALQIRNPSPLLKDVPEDSFVYFVHTYCGVPENPENIIASAEYGSDVCAIVQNGYAFGCQFHPEKSGEAGLLIFKNFAEMKL